MKQNSLKFLVEEEGVNFYAWRLVQEGFYLPIVKRYCGQYLKSDIIKIKNGKGNWAPDTESWNKMGKLIIDKVENNTLDLNKLLKEHTAPGNNIFKLCKLIENKDFSNLSNDYFLDWLKNAWKEYISLSGAGFVPVVSDFDHLYLTSKLTDILASKKLGFEKIQDYLSILSSMSRKTLTWKENLELLSICKKYKTQTKTIKSNDLKIHTEKYCWLNYGYQGPAWSKEDFAGRIKLLFSNKSSIDKQYSEHNSHLINLRKKQSAIENKLKLNTKEKRYFKSTRMFMYLKSYRVESRHRFYYTSDLILRMISKRFNIPLSELHYCLKEEIIKILKGGNINHRKILLRKDFLVFATDNKKSNFIPQNRSKKFLERVIISEKIAKTDTISGQVAYPGSVKGTVKIVNSPKDIKKVNKGDIMVSICTNPDLLPAMNKAAAFITDAGSITSHASIVSREMKKPCVIGTKNATKILKDGDKVKVDAKKGIVNKL